MMLPHEIFIRAYEANGYRVFVYPLFFGVVGGVVWGIIANRLPEIYSVPLLGIFLGLSYGLIGKSFGFEKVMLPSIIVSFAVILCSLLTLFAGLYFGAYFIPVGFGSLIFSILLFVIDYYFSAKLVDLECIWLYLLSGLLVIFVFYAAIIIDWKKNFGWLCFVIYPFTMYIYLQISIACRLGYT